MWKRNEATQEYQFIVDGEIKHSIGIEFAIQHPEAVAAMGAEFVKRSVEEFNKTTDS